MPALSNMKRLWVHEILRVFGDRLVDEIDIDWLIQQINITLKERMVVPMEELFEDLLSEKEQKVRLSQVSLLIKKIKLCLCIMHFCRSP